jgi:hypothetical protein
MEADPKRSVFAIGSRFLIALDGCLKPHAETDVHLAATSLRDARARSTCHSDNSAISGGIPTSTSLAHPGDNFRHGSEKSFSSGRMSDPHLIPRLIVRVRVLLRQRILTDHAGHESFRAGREPALLERRERIAGT